MTLRHGPRLEALAKLLCTLSREPMSIYMLSKQTGLARPTVMKYVEYCASRGWVEVLKKKPRHGVYEAEFKVRLLRDISLITLGQEG